MPMEMLWTEARLCTRGSPRCCRSSSIIVSSAAIPPPKLRMGRAAEAGSEVGHRLKLRMNDSTSEKEAVPHLARPLSAPVARYQHRPAGLTLRGLLQRRNHGVQHPRGS